MHIITRVVLEYPFHQQGQQLTTSQYVALLLPVCMFITAHLCKGARLKWVLVLFLTSSQLLKKWTPVFKNYVKKTQDQVDCLSAFEEHFLEQDTHWAAMFKVAITPVKVELQLQRKMLVMEPLVFPFRSSWTCTNWRFWRRRWYCDGSPRESPPTKADSSAKTRGYVQFISKHLTMSVT